MYFNSVLPFHFLCHLSLCKVCITLFKHTRISHWTHFCFSCWWSPLFIIWQLYLYLQAAYQKWLFHKTFLCTPNSAELIFKLASPPPRLWEHSLSMYTLVNLTLKKRFHVQKNLHNSSSLHFCLSLPSPPASLSFHLLCQNSIYTIRFKCAQNSHNP